MFNNEQQMVLACKEVPSMIFKIISKGYFEVVEKLIEDNTIDVNLTDTVGNDVVTRLLKARQYDLVIQLMKKKNWDVNHQNLDGNTFGHILAQDDSFMAISVVEQLKKKMNFLPNIKNNKGETIIDIALSNNYLSTAFKILEDKRFNSISIISFKTLFNVCIKNKKYGKYSKISNLEIIVDSLEKKELDSDLTDLILHLHKNMDTIKRDILNNNFRLVDSLISSY